MTITLEQERYINAIIEKSDEDLLYEVASGSLIGVTASAKPPYDPSKPESRRQYLYQLQRRVPNGPVSEYAKPALVPHLPLAQRTIQTAHTRLYRMLCDPATKTPNKVATEICSGEARNIIVNLASLLLTQYDMAIAMGLPTAVFLMRTGIHKFCALGLSTS
jgi:hypothetical protein